MESKNCSLPEMQTLQTGASKCTYNVSCNSSSHLLVNFTAANEDFCLTQEEYLEKYLGPRRSSLFMPMCVVYLLIFLVGAVGNVLTCTVIARNKVMRTPTNYYLFSLAVSDLLVLMLGMPLELYEMWSNYPFVFGKGGCYFKTFLFETVCFASILIVTSLSVERYIAVIYPLKAKFVVTRTHAKRVILAMWIISVLCAIPNTSLHGIVSLPSATGQAIPESAICMLVKPRWMYNVIIQITTLLFFLLPMFTISWLYLLIGLQLKREKIQQMLIGQSAHDQDGCCSSHSQQQKVRHRQVTKMLFVLVIVFGICWAPFHTDRLMWSFISHWTSDHLAMFQYVHIISGVFFYLSSAANPILYNLMSTRFRDMFREVMCRRTRHPVARKHSLSVTRVTLRSTICELPSTNGVPVVEGEDSNIFLDGILNNDATTLT